MSAAGLVLMLLAATGLVIALPAVAVATATLDDELGVYTANPGVARTRERTDGRCMIK